MTNSLKIEASQTGTALYVKLTGQLDEHAEYFTPPATGITAIVFDFAGITLINSVGIQKWIHFFAGLPPAARISFTRCTLRIINQINLFPDFTAGRSVTVETFYAPYFCETCDESCTVLLTRAVDFRTSAIKAPQRPCPHCQAPMLFDGIEDKYLRFLKQSA